MSFTDNFGQAQEIDMSAKVGDDIEELTAYINGQQDSVKASVTEDGKLQMFTGNNKVEGSSILWQPCWRTEHATWQRCNG